MVKKQKFAGKIMAGLAQIDPVEMKYVKYVSRQLQDTLAPSATFAFVVCSVTLTRIIFNVLRSSMRIAV